MNSSKKYKAIRKKTLTDEIKSGYTMLVTMVILLNLVLGGTYLIINGQKTVLGYKLKEAQLSSESLRDEIKDVDSKIVEVQSFSTLEARAASTEKEEIGVIEYSVSSPQTALQY